MSHEKIILFTILVSFIVIEACKSNNRKVTTGSQTFLKLRSGQTTKCKFINRDFHKLKGTWHYVLRTVTSKNEPKMRCGHLVVNNILSNGFVSTLDYMTSEGATVKVPITGLFINETIVGVPELNDIIMTYPEMRSPFFVQMGLCEDDTIFFIESMYYYGGFLLFTRNIPDSVTALKLRFGTYDEQRGKEQMLQIDFDCTVKK